MSNFPKFAPHSIPDVLDRILFWAIRIAAVTFLFSVVGVAFIGTTPIAFWLVVISAIVWFVAFVLRWLLHRFA
jgi:hypothetical protein